VLILGLGRVLTPSGQKLGRNPAAQQAPALILGNPLSCDPVQGPTMHSRQWKRRELITLFGSICTDYQRLQQ
jgi:hypothetical protein